MPICSTFFESVLYYAVHSHEVTKRKQTEAMFFIDKIIIRIIVLR